MNKKIKIERIKKGWNQEQLAKETGISRGTLTKIENGMIDGIRFGIIKQLATTLNTTVQELFFSNEE